MVLPLVEVAELLVAEYQGDVVVLVILFSQTFYPSFNLHLLFNFQPQQYQLFFKCIVLLGISVINLLMLICFHKSFWLWRVGDHVSKSQMV